MNQQPAQDPNKKPSDSAVPQMNTKMFQYMMPVMSLVICTTTSAAYALYWTTTSAIAVISFFIMNKILDKHEEEFEMAAIEQESSRKMERKLPKI